MKQRRSSVRLALMLVVGVIAALVTGAFGEWAYAPTVGWCFASLLYSTTVWLRVGRLDAKRTASHAGREEPARGVVDLMVILLSLASLFSVAFVLVHASISHGTIKVVLAALALISVALSWILLHTLFTLRYAREFYRPIPGQGTAGGVDFNQKDAPQYTDFAYLAFTLGMTYQVSDTNLTSHAIRSTALQHGLLSFVFGSVILATTINLVAGLS